MKRLRQAKNSGTKGAESGAPYLSIVAASRNDDHGGGLLARMQIFVDGLVAQCERHALDVELILVEWNPPEGRPRLKDALRWPEGGGRTTVRIIEVTPELHRRYEYSEGLPLFQMIAKNVGIRRARGPFVLATNIDLLFSDGVMQTLASGKLKGGVLYRVERYDVEADIPTDVGMDEQLSWCQEHLLRAHFRHASPSLRPVEEEPSESAPPPPAVVVAAPAVAPPLLVVPPSLVAPPSIAAKPPVLAAASATPPRRVSQMVLRKARTVIRSPRSLYDVPVKLTRATRRRLRRMLRATVSRVLRATTRRVLRMVRATVRRARTLVTKPGPALAKVRKQVSVWREPKRLHTNACGDFTLMSRADWSRLRGYPELELYSLHIDTLLLHMGRQAGLREEVLRDPIFHVEHDGGYQPDEDGKTLFEHLQANGVPWLTPPELRVWTDRIAERKTPLDINDNDWGLALEALSEEVMVL